MFFRFAGGLAAARLAHCASFCPLACDGLSPGDSCCPAPWSGEPSASLNVDHRNVCYESMGVSPVLSGGFPCTGVHRRLVSRGNVDKDRLGSRVTCKSCVPHCLRCFCMSCLAVGRLDGVLRPNDPRLVPTFKPADHGAPRLSNVSASL